MILFRDEDGRTLTAENLRGVTGTLQYEVMGTRDVPEEARALHQQARQAGGNGDYMQALALLEKASLLAPHWPYPVYDTAYTLLLLKDFNRAREWYRKTLKLSPRGFFTAITALDCLEKERKGNLPAGTYLAYLSLEWMQDPAEKARAVRQLARQAPHFAPIWRDLAALTENDSEKLAAIEQGLAANPDAETEGMLRINKALTLKRLGDHDGAVRMLGELALDPESPFDIEHIAKACLATIVSSELS
jgi:tetratricopeptide (TPR) repeat protein